MTDPASLALLCAGAGPAALGAIAAHVRARRLERALAARESERAARVARELHDLRTPLTVIRGECHALDRQEASDRARARAALIDAEAARVADGLERLGSLAAGVSGRRDPALGRVDLGDLARGVVRRHRGAADERGVRLAAVVRDAAQVAGCADALDRALDNLVANAVRHARAGGAVRVTVRALWSDAVVRVSDDGAGVHPDDAARIFRPGERGRAPVGHGRGLGLAIAREIAEDHGGRVELDSAAPGATFCLRVPLAGRGAAGLGSAA